MKADTLQDKTTLRTPDIRLARRWATATAAGYAVIMPTYFVVSIFRPTGLYSYEYWSLPLLISVIAGLGVMSLLQGFILRGYIVNFLWLKWTLFTLFGYSFGLFLIALYVAFPQVLLWLQGYYSGSDHADFADFGRLCAFMIIAPCLQGFLIGYSQSRLLKPAPSEYVSWITANVFAVIASVILVAAAIGFQLQTNVLFVSAPIAAIGGALAGAITGLQIVRVLRKTSIFNILTEGEPYA